MEREVWKWKDVGEPGSRSRPEKLAMVEKAEEVLRGTYNAYVRPPPFARPASAGARQDGLALDAPQIAPGVTFVVGYHPEGFGAWVVDRDGTVLHRWRARFSDIFGAAPQLLWQARDETIAWLVTVSAIDSSPGCQANIASTSLKTPSRAM